MPNREVGPERAFENNPLYINLLESRVPADHVSLVLPGELPPQVEVVHPGVPQHAAHESCHEENHNVTEAAGPSLHQHLGGET